MNRFNRLLAVIVLAGHASLAFTAEPAGQQHTAWERFKAYAHQEKSVAVKEGKKLIASTDRHIGQLKADAKKANKETKAAYEADIKALEEKKKEAKVHLDKMGKASASAWDATKDGFANAYRDLHQAYDQSVAAAKK